MGYRESNAMLRRKFHLYRVLLDIVRSNNYIKTVFTTTGRTFKSTSCRSGRGVRDSCEGRVVQPVGKSRYWDWTLKNRLGERFLEREKHEEWQGDTINWDDDRNILWFAWSIRFIRTKTGVENTELGVHVSDGEEPTLHFHISKCASQNSFC